MDTWVRITEPSSTEMVLVSFSSRARYRPTLPTVPEPRWSWEDRPADGPDQNHGDNVGPSRESVTKRYTFRCASVQTPAADQNHPGSGDRLREAAGQGNQPHRCCDGTGSCPGGFTLIL